MLLTTRQAAEKLGVSPTFVARLIRTGKLPGVGFTGKASPSGRVNYGIDPKVLREFKQTFVPPTPKVRKANGHAQDVPLPLDIDPPLALVGAALMRIEAKLDELLGYWK